VEFSLGCDSGIRESEQFGADTWNGVDRDIPWGRIARSGEWLFTGKIIIYTVDCIRIACRSLACPLTCLLFESSRFLSPPFCAGRGFAHSDHDLASNIRIRRCAR
jgi:hypothetical protein